MTDFVSLHNQTAAIAEQIAHLADGSYAEALLLMSENENERELRREMEESRENLRDYVNIFT